MSPLMQGIQDTAAQVWPVAAVGALGGLGFLLGWAWRDLMRDEVDPADGHPSWPELTQRVVDIDTARRERAR